MAKKKTKTKKKNTVRFEESLAALEQIVMDLEQGKLSLDESLKKYESGMAHLRKCYSALNEAEKQIHLLVNVDEDGSAQVANFDHVATHEEANESDSGSNGLEPDDGSLF